MIFFPATRFDIRETNLSPEPKFLPAQEPQCRSRVDKIVEGTTGGRR
jgi:hypothetical protein